MKRCRFLHTLALTLAFTFSLALFAQAQIVIKLAKFDRENGYGPVEVNSNPQFVVMQ